MLFSDERKHKISVPKQDEKGNKVTVGWLVDHLCQNVMKDTRKELFVLDDHVWATNFLSHSFSSLARLLRHRQLVKAPSCISFVCKWHARCFDSTSNVSDIDWQLECAYTVGQVSWFSSMTQTGNSKAKHPTNSKRTTTSCLCQHCMVAERE